MAMKILLVALLVFVCTGYAKDIPYSLDEDMCGQCPTILSKLKDHTLAQMESLTSEDRLLTLCDLEDPDLQEQCYELLGEHGEEFMEMLKSVDEGLMCEEICKHLEDTDQDDYKLYFQAERGATNTDVEDVGGFACSICKKFMTLIHVYLSNRRNQAIVIRLLKAACRFVPFFHTECNLIVSMYGRLIINLAARYLSPRLCYSFRLCPRNLPGSCADILKWERRGAKSGPYTVYTFKKEPFSVYCSFQDKHIDTYISTRTAISVDVSRLYNNKKHVTIRYLNKYGKQYESQLGQIAAFKSTYLSVQFNGTGGYTNPQNRNMSPFLFLGFIPKSQSRKGAVQGYNANGRDYTFRNCDGNPNSYFAFLFNQAGQAPVKYGPFDSALMHAWEKSAMPVAENKRIPCEFFSFFEIHFGGCGGYATTAQFPGVAGAALGLRYGITCDEPESLADGSVTYDDTALGSTAIYSCNHGYAMMPGDVRRTCGQDGEWTGEAPTCVREQDVLDVWE